MAFGQIDKKDCTMSEPVSFQTKGNDENEITLRFDDGRELFVSSAFLKEMSPVFKAMLELDFKERKDGVIELKEKNFDHFLVFLQCIHPIHYKALTAENVFGVVSLADEYQVPLATGSCKSLINTMMDKCYRIDFVRLDNDPLHIGDDARDLFNNLCDILHNSLKYSFKHEIERAVDILTKYPLQTYIQTQTFYSLGGNYRSFSSLPDHIKGRILYKRVKVTKPEEKKTDRSFLTTFI